ncbi:MAG: hypothetical protein R3E13_00875 [Alphaproteobacteria bacterium]
MDKEEDVYTFENTPFTLRVGSCYERYDERHKIYVLAEGLKHPRLCVPTTHYFGALTKNPQLSEATDVVERIFNQWINAVRLNLEFYRRPMQGMTQDTAEAALCISQTGPLPEDMASRFKLEARYLRRLVQQAVPEIQGAIERGRGLSILGINKAVLAADERERTELENRGAPERSSAFNTSAGGLNKVVPFRRKNMPGENEGPGGGMAP